MIAPLAALFAVLAVVPLTVPLARRLGAVARLGQDRWSRRSVTTLGGIGLSTGLIAGTVLSPLGVVERLAIVLGVVVLLILGLRDDLSFVSPRARLAVQALIGVAFTAAVAAERPAFLLTVPLAALAVPLAVNATNMVDNADGLAATLSIVTAAILAGTAVAVVPSGDGFVLSWIIVAGCVGFVVYNVPPARVFMGDAGSLPLGFALAAASILLMRAASDAGGEAPAAVFLAIITAWAIQLGDVGMVFVTRLHRGRSPFRGGVDHTSHRLMRAGLTPGATVALLASMAAACGLIGLLAAARADIVTTAFITLGVVGGVAIFETVLARRTSHAGEPRLDGRHEQQPRPRSGRLLRGSKGES